MIGIDNAFIPIEEEKEPSSEENRAEDEQEEASTEEEGSSEENNNSNIIEGIELIEFGIKMSNKYEDDIDSYAYNENLVENEDD